MQRGNRIFREMEERKFYVDWTGWARKDESEQSCDKEIAGGLSK